MPAVETFEPVARFREERVDCDVDSKKFFGLDEYDEKLLGSLFLVGGALVSAAVVIVFFRFFGFLVNDFFGMLLGLAVLAAGLVLAARLGDGFFRKKKAATDAYRAEYSALFTAQLQGRGWKIDNFIAEGTLNRSSMEVEHENGLKYLTKDVIFTPGQMRVTFMLVSEVFVKTQETVFDSASSAAAFGWRGADPEKAFLAGVEWAAQHKG